MKFLAIFFILTIVFAVAFSARQLPGGTADYYPTGQVGFGNQRGSGNRGQNRRGWSNGR
jgi:hypothetical protein